MKIRSPHVEDLGFQIAPMCDVLLVLLVFFISITATSALRSDRAIELPVGPNATKKATARSEALINVKWVPEKSAGVVEIESKVITELPAVTEGGSIAERRGLSGAFWTGALAAFVATP